MKWVFLPQWPPNAGLFSITRFLYSWQTPSEIVFQEQSNSSLHSGWSLAWDHFCGDIDDPCGSSPISALLLLIRAPLSLSMGQSADTRSVMPIVARLAEHRKTSWNPFGNCLPRTELLQSLFRTEFSMRSLSRQYQRSLWHHCRFLQSYHWSMRRCRDPWGNRRTRGRPCRSLRNSLNIVKHC